MSSGLVSWNGSRLAQLGESWSSGLPPMNFGRTNAPRRMARYVIARHARGLAGDVRGRVADAEHQHVAVDEALIGLAVPVRVQLLAGEAVLAGEGRLGVLGVPVVAVGDHDRVVAARLAVGERDLPAVAGRLDAGHLGAERDPVAEPEVIDVGLEVAGYLRVMRIVRVVRRHRVGGVLHHRPRRVDEQRAVGGRHPVVVAVAPVAADARAFSKQSNSMPRA